MSNEFTPQQLNLSPDTVVVIGTVALPSGPVRVSVSTAPKIAIAQNVSGYSSVKNVGKEDSMVTITAIFNDEFVDDASIDYKGMKIPADMYSLLSLLELMPFVPIYSSELAKLIAANTSSDYFFGALQSIAVRQYSDFDRTFEVTMSFLITDISPYMGNVIGYREVINEAELAVGAMYLSKYINGLVAEEKRKKLTSSSNANNILIGIDSFTVINNFESYVSKIKRMISDISESSAQNIVNDIETLNTQVSTLEKNLKSSLAYTFNQMNEEIRSASENSTITVSRFTFSDGETSLFKILLENIVNISVGYDNYINPTYMQDSSVPIHSFMGRSPVSAEVSFVCPNANDVLIFKTLYNQIQKMHRDIDFLGYSMPATLTGEIFNLIGMQNATITKIDISSMDEVPNSFMVNIVFVDGSKGVMTESASATILDDTKALAENIANAAFEELANAAGIASTSQDWLMQYFLNNSFDDIQSKISDTEKLNRELIIDVARIMDAVAQAVTDISVTGGLVKLMHDDFRNVTSFVATYVWPFFGFKTGYIKSSFPENSTIKGNERLARNFVAFNSIAHGNPIDVEYSNILSDLYAESNNGELPDYWSRIFDKLFIKEVKEIEEQSSKKLEDIEKDFFIPLAAPISLDAPYKEINGFNYVIPKITLITRERYFHGIGGYGLDGDGTQNKDYLGEFLIAYHCASFGDAATTLNYTMIPKGLGVLEKEKIIRNRELVVEDFITTIDKNHRHLKDIEEFSVIYNDMMNFLDKLWEIQVCLKKARTVLMEQKSENNASGTKIQFKSNEDLFKNYAKYFEFSGLIIDILLNTTHGTEIIMNKDKANVSYSNVLQGSAKSVTEYTDETPLSITGTVIYINRDKLLEESKVEYKEIEQEVFKNSVSVPGVLFSHLNGYESAKEFVEKCLFQSDKVLEACYIFEYDISKAISTMDDTMLASYGSVIRKAITNEAQNEYTLINPNDFFVEGHDFRVIDTVISKSDKIASGSASVYKKGIYLDEKITIDGELKNYTGDQIVNAFVNDLEMQIARCNYYINNNEYSNDGTVRNYISYISDVLKGGSTGYVNGEKVEKLFDDMIAEKFISLQYDENEGYKKIVVNEAKINENEENAKRFVELMEEAITLGRLNENALVSDSYTEDTYSKQMFSISDGIRSSTLGIHNMCPQMFAIFMWTKDNYFIPTQYMFEYRGIISAEIQKSREDPADKAVVVFSNTRSILTDSTVNDYQYITKEPSGLASSIDKLLVKAGVAIQLITFSKGKKYKIFEGIISGVQYQGNTVTVIADGYGSALQKPIYTKENEKLGGFCTNPREMVVESVNRTNSIRLGCDEGGYINLIKRTIENMNSKAELFLFSDKFFMPRWRYSDLGINIYSPDQYWPLLTKSNIKGSSYFEQYQADYRVKAGYSAWDVITDSLNRVPGFIARVVDFDAGSGRLFFGKPEWTYAYTSKLDPQFWKRAATKVLEDFGSKALVIKNTITEVMKDYAENIIKEFNSMAYDDIEVVKMHSESLNGFTFNVPEDIPTKLETDGTVVASVKNSGAEPDTYLYDGDTLYSSSIEGTHTGYRFIGYDAEELKDDNGKLIDYGLNHRDAAFALIRHSGEKILLVPTGTVDNYGRHVVYPYIKYNGSVDSLKGKWISLSSLMISSGYIKELLFGYHQDTDFLRKNIKYYNYYHDSKISQEKSVGSESVLSAFIEIKDRYLQTLGKYAEYIHLYLSSLSEETGKSLYQGLLFDVVPAASRAIDEVIDSYKNNSKSVIKYIEEIVHNGDISGTSVENVFVEPLNAIQSAALTVSSSASEAIRLAAQINNSKYASENPEQRLFHVVESMAEAERYMNLPGTKMYKNDWIAMSRVNLIDDGIMTDSSNVFNQVMITGRRNDADVWPIFKQIWRFIKYIFGAAEGDVEGDEQRHIIMADNDIPEWERKTMIVTDKWADTFQTRIIVGTSVLINSLKNMYQGEITIIGNPSIKPHDGLYIHDEQNDIDGTVTVRTVRHHFGQGIGFVTRIEVDPIIEARDLSVSTSSIWLGRLAKVAIGAGLITIGIATGGTGLLPALGGFAAGVAASRGVNSILGSILMEHGNYSAVSGKQMYADDASQVGAYISTTEAFNLLKIKPLSKSNRPLVAGINGYSVTEMDSWKYIIDKNKKSWDDFLLGAKMFGYSYEYLYNYSQARIGDLVTDLIQYMESLNND